MDKQIEEEIHKLKIAMCSYEDCEECPTSWCYAEECATMAICKGYRKIPEGSVVLTKEEFNEFRQTIITQSQEYTKRCNEMNDKIINARKEAVKEVLEKINEKLCAFYFESNSQEYSDGYVDAIAEVNGRLDKIAKEFGVEP